MTRIDSGQQLAALLRQQVTSLRRSAGAGAGTAAAVSGSASQAGAATDIAAVVAQRIQGISAQDPQRRHTAIRIFLESVLLQELGPQLVNDPSFPDMVEAVHRQMQQDQEMSAAADQLAGVLLAGGPGPRS